MKKIIVLVAMLMLASVAFAQLSYVGTDYTGSNVKRSQSTVLGMHDVLATSTPGGVINADYNGCQSCHVPHEANQTAGSEYLWKYAINTNAAVPTLDAASFHTLACLSCHDGATAADVKANLEAAGNFGMTKKTLPTQYGYGYALIDPAELAEKHHPVHALQVQHSTAPFAALATTITAKTNFIKWYQPATAVTSVDNGDGTSSPAFGYVECGSCHDPHKGDGATYMFLRGPKAGTNFVDPKDAGITYVGTTPQYARLGLCRQCHGK